MMLNYIAIVHQDKPNGVYGACFPDFLGCVTSAKSLDELYEACVEALSFHLEGLIEDGEAVPQPMSLAAAMKHKLYKGALSTFMVRVGNPAKQERINIVLSQTDLQIIDRAVDKTGGNRSAFLVEAALARVRQPVSGKSA
jgi:predicted RNase H-like HicB family nuclease